MDDEDRNPVRSAPRRRRLSLPVAVLLAIVGAAVGAVFLMPLASGRSHRPVSRLIYCDSTISWDPGAGTEITGGRKVRLPGGGGFACGQLEVQPGGSEPVAVDLWTGTVGLSATMPHVPVTTLDLSMNHRLTPMSFRPGREYLLMLDEDPEQAHMFIYSGNGSSMVISLHLVFCANRACPCNVSLACRAE